MNSKMNVSADIVIFNTWTKTEAVSESLKISISVTFNIPMIADEFQSQCSNQYGRNFEYMLKLCKEFKWLRRELINFFSII